MKWRPISELSDEQRDGRWWLFVDEIRHNGCVYIETLRFDNITNSWANEDGNGYANDCVPDYKYFLSKPLPKLPEQKPKPFEVCWVDVDDRLPEEYKDVFIGTEMGYTTIGYYTINGWLIDMSYCKDTSVRYWMPMIKGPCD